MPTIATADQISQLEACAARVLTDIRAIVGDADTEGGIFGDIALLVPALARVSQSMPEGSTLKALQGVARGLGSCIGQLPLDLRLQVTLVLSSEIQLGMRQAADLTTPKGAVQ